LVLYTQKCICYIKGKGRGNRYPRKIEYSLVRSWGAERETKICNRLSLNRSPKSEGGEQKKGQRSFENRTRGQREDY